MTVTAPCGKLTGIQNQYGTSYLGIPYAEIPSGRLAFRNPVPKRPWNGTFHADIPGHNPLQYQGGYGLGDISEDCLYLNVFVPDHPKEKILPVMVWIYGGSWAAGGTGKRRSGSEEHMYDMSFFARETETIVVTFNYRLNVYGFLNLHALSDRFDLNVGLKDQILALKWIRENIASFGGNPENITLFGQSAGAASILALLSIKEAAPLFHKSILQSSCTDHFWTYEEAERNTILFLRILHIPPNHPEMLLKKSQKEILEAVHKAGHILYPKGDIRCFFAPVIDGELLKDEPKKIFDPQKPMLMGTVEDEADIIIANVPKILLPYFEKVMPFHIDKGRGYSKRFSAALTEWIYRKPMHEVLNRIQTDAWVYQYDYILSSEAQKGLGAYHASELPVLFGWPDSSFFKNDLHTEKTGREMRHAWSAFAHNGSVEWNSFQQTGTIWHFL